MTAALRRLQRWFAAAVTAPVAPRVGHRLETGGALDAAARLDVYRFAYRERLVSVLVTEHPGVHRLVGDRAFRALAHDYVAACPSRHCNLNRFAARFAAFVARSRRPMPHQAFAADVARVEAAMSAAFDAAERPPLPRDALAAIAPELHATLRFQLHPSVRLLACRFPTSAWLDARRAGTRPRVPPPQRTWTVVYRRAFAVGRMSLARREHAVLRAIAGGASLANALRRARPGDPVAQWFDRWSAAGLFTAVEAR